jgi:hypothetical protein
VQCECDSNCGGFQLEVAQTRTKTKIRGACTELLGSGLPLAVQLQEEIVTNRQYILEFRAKSSIERGVNATDHRCECVSCVVLV